MKKLLLFTFALILALGCSTTTKQNTTALYRVPPLQSQLQPLSGKSTLLTTEPLPPECQADFKRLYALDPSLAVEVGRLPEFQGKVEPKQSLALSRFTHMVENATAEEKVNLAELRRVGQADFRKYCAPLQALFWLLEEEEYSREKNPIGSCSPEQVVDELIVEAWDFSEEERWQDYEEVTDRLNAPELVDYYERCRFTYHTTRIGTTDERGYKRRIFKTNRGDCIDYAAFTIYCLRKGGYKARELRVPSPSGRKFHAVCVFHMKGQEYVIDNSYRHIGIRLKEDLYPKY